MKIELKKPLAGDRPAEEEDVRGLKRGLNWLGYYTPLETTGVTPLPDARVFDALRRFQVDHGLPPTGTARPGDETLTRLNREVAKRLKGER